MPAAEAKDSSGLDSDVAAFINGTKTSGDEKPVLASAVSSKPATQKRGRKAAAPRDSESLPELSSHRRKLTAMVSHSTLVALERCYAEYYPVVGPRLEKRDIVDQALARVFSDPELMREVFGAPPGRS